MRPDLVPFAITNEDLTRLTGIDVDAMKLYKKIKYIKTLGLLVRLTVMIFFGLTVALSGNLLFFMFYSLALYIIFNDTFFEMRKLYLWGKKPSKHLLKILKEVERYNDILKAIDIKDRLEEAGNPGTGLSNREQVIEALRITKHDLVRALKTERILRENKSFIEGHPERFANNLIALTALQVSDKASEHGQIIDEALQIAVSVQREMRKLESKR